MNRLRTSSLLVLVGLSLIVLGAEAFEALDPPFSDQEISASFVDTWEPHAITTAAELFALFAMAIVSVVAGYGSRIVRIRRLTLIAVALCLAAGIIAFVNHVNLTERTTRLTGQQFGGLYGLL